MVWHEAVESLSATVNQVPSFQTIQGPSAWVEAAGGRGCPRGGYRERRLHMGGHKVEEGAKGRTQGRAAEGRQRRYWGRKRGRKGGRKAKVSSV
jgi:hypothetical protein